MAKRSPRSSAPIDAPPPATSPVPDADVARRAYEIFESRGAEHGRDLDDWIQAKRELAPDEQF